MIVENEKHRNGLMQALNSACDNITISGIYQSNDSSVVEEAYETHEIKLSTDSPSIIIQSEYLVENMRIMALFMFCQIVFFRLS